MGVTAVTENSANKANYDVNASDLDRAIDAITELKKHDPSLARKIDNLEAQYEQAIRLRRMRIETLESHISDRDDELVEYRRHMEAHYRSERKLRVLSIVLGVAVLITAALAFVPRETFAAAEFAYTHSCALYSLLPEHPFMFAMGTALVSVGVTCLVKK